MKKIVLLAILGVSGIVNAQVVNLSLSLTACYSLNGNATEPINALTGTLSAVTPTANRFNQANTAVFFNGTTGSYIQLPNSPLLKPANGLSFSAWIKPIINGYDNQEVLFTKNIYSSFFSAYALTIQYGAGGMVFRGYRQDGNGDDTVDGTTVLNSNTWYHVVLTIDNNFMKVYVNGVLEGTSVSTKSYNYDSNAFVILGGTNDYVNYPFNGAMDNTRFYKRAISAAEVVQLYTTDPSCSPTTGLNQSVNDKSGLTLFPNPAINELTLKIDEEFANYSVSDLTGKEVLKGAISDETSKHLNISELSPGVYLIKLTANGRSQVQKFIKD